VLGTCILSWLSYDRGVAACPCFGTYQNRTQLNDMMTKLADGYVCMYTCSQYINTSTLSKKRNNPSRVRVDIMHLSTTLVSSGTWQQALPSPTQAPSTGHNNDSLPLPTTCCASQLHVVHARSIAFGNKGVNRVEATRMVW
jgi:hypothetical protein